MVTIHAADDPDVSGISLLDVSPWKGRLVPLKTKDELRAALETFDAYVVGVRARHAGAVLNTVRELLPDLKTADFQHLRRVVLPQFLPEHLQASFQVAQSLDTSLSEPLSDDAKPSDVEIRFLLTCPAAAIPAEKLRAALRQYPPFLDSSFPLEIYTIAVPALAPTSSEQAAQWSRDYWPISYKNTNPYGPHPSLLARNAAEIEQDAGAWLALAGEAGNQISECCLGENIGCVVVDMSWGDAEIIAVAADCRWRSPAGCPTSKEGPGNVMAHAVQRAIAMVAKKRLRIAGTDPDSVSTSELFCGSPLTDIERQFYIKDNIPPNGYLCTDLDIYLTHEPCVMCSMAILHSRFRRCVFDRRMPLTGGLAAEFGGAGESVSSKNIAGLPQGLGHGIFWRPMDLNWKFLAWEWEHEDGYGTASQVVDTLQA